MKELLNAAKEYLPLVPLAGAYAYLLYKLGDFARESEEGGREDGKIIGNNETAALEERLEVCPSFGITDSKDK